MKLCLHCMEQYPDQEQQCPHCGFDRENAQGGSGLPLECILAKRYLVGCVMHTGQEMISYIGWDEYLQCKVEIQEYYPLGTVCRDADGINVQLLSGSMQEDFRNGARRFLYEARRLVPYMHYSCMLKIIDTFKENNTIYIVRKYETGQLLSEYMKQKKLPEERAVQEINSVLDFLSSLHAGGMLIGDLSPERILITDDGSLRISDCSQVIDVGTLSKQAEKATYIGYLPMEAASAPMSPVSDVYSAGALLYAMLTGEDPMPPAARLSHNQELTFPEDAGISEMTRTALHNALQPRAADRTQTTEQFRQELNGQGATRVIGGKIQELHDTFTWKRWHKFALIAAAALLLIICLAVGFSSKGHGMSGLQTMNAGSASVPDVRNMPQDEALRVLEENGFRGQVETSIYNANVEKGNVIFQSITPGQDTKFSETILLTISNGKELYDLPNLVGRVYEDIVAEMPYFRFEPIYMEAGKSKFPEGVISDQDTPAGSYGPDEVITVHIAGKSGADQQNAEIPIQDYTGMKLTDELKKSIIAPVTIQEEECDDPSQIGKVIRQDPEPGNYPPKTVLTLYIGKERKARVLDNYVGSNANTAESELRHMMLKVERIEEENSNYRAGNVFQQSPPAGTEIKAGDKITLYVSTGNDNKITSIPMQNYVGQDYDSVAGSIISEAKRINISVKIPDPIYEPNDQFPRDTIIKQSIPAGGYLNDNGSILFTLSEGPASEPDNGNPEESADQQSSEEADLPKETETADDTVQEETP